MKKLLTILTLLLMALTTAWAGEQTITISRKDGQFSSAEGVYYFSKGGVTVTFSGGMNDKNYLVLRHTNTVTFKSANFNIKSIIFHSLDNFQFGNNDVFYWGPTTMNVMPVQLRIDGQSTTVTPGRYTATPVTTYDGTWTSDFSGTWTSVFRNTNADGEETRTHTKFPNGFPAGNQLIFGSRGKPIRFSSIDIVIEKENGDIYDLVTSDDEIQENQTYVLVSQSDSRALSTNLVEGPATNNAAKTETFASTPVTFPVADKSKVRTTEEVQLIKLEHPQYYEARPWVLKVTNGYLRRRSSNDHLSTSETDNRGWNLYKVDNLPTGGSSDINWYYYRVSISVSGNINNNALIRFYHNESGASDYNYAIRHRNSSNYFRDLDYSSANPDAANQRVYLYKPAQNYKVYTTVMPNDDYGTIELRDGVIVANGENTSQKFETVSFLVTPAVGKKVASISIAKDGDPSVVVSPDAISSTMTTNGILYSFEMPSYDVLITATFEDVTYHNVNVVVSPDVTCGNVFLTEGYVVQQDQVKSYDGQNVVFNVTPNPVNINDENDGYYELYNVTLTDDVTGVVTVLTPDAQGNYSFTMPDNSVTITANFKVKHYIGTTCNPEAGGHFANNDLNMTCNGVHTDFWEGAQYYIGDEMAFWAYTKDGYRINKVTIHEVDNPDNVTTLTPIETQNYGNHYSFTMPNYDVWITAYFYKTVPDLYLLGTHNGISSWHSYGPKFNYDADNQKYWIDVYYKGVNTDYGLGTSNDSDKYGYFSITKEVKSDKDHADDWSISGRYGSSNGNNYKILGDYGSSTTTATGGLISGENAFMVPAGIYRIEVTKDNNDNPSQVTITRQDVNLNFDPAGGTEDNPAQVSWGTEVTMASNIQDLVHNLSTAYATDYPQYVPNDYNEADVSFDYSIAETADLNNVKQNGTSTLADPTFTLVEYNIDEEVPVIVKVEANAWIGWIHAPENAYYQVVKTPLNWIEENGTPGEKYTVSNELLAVYRANNSLWCKDMLPYKSNAYHTPFTPDYMVDFAEQGRTTVGYENENDNSIWDQSNWVELDFSNLENGASIADDLKGKKLAAGTVKGVYSKPNHKIVLTSAPTEGQALAYVPNSFCPVNFLDKNIDNDGAAGANNTNFFFVNPKVQEYAVVTMAVWVGNNKFVVPAMQQNGEVNGNDFDGAFNVNWTLNNWDCFNEDCPQDQSGKLNQAESDNGTQAYHFHAIIRVPESSKANGPARINVTPKPDQTPSDNYMIFPLDLIVNSDHIITAVSRLDTAKAVQSVTYSDLAGRTSSKPFAGVNIVITRYTDGTIVTSKQVR